MNEEKFIRALKEVRRSCTAISIMFSILYILLLQFTTPDKLTPTGISLVTCVGIRTLISIFIEEYEKS
jgi:hypothetical protein